ncbi:hypothetical protein Plhal304r1_c080g0166291 [Plasmopara halstedii]
MCSVCWKKTMSDRQAAVASPRATEAKVDVATVVETAASASADIVDNKLGFRKKQLRRCRRKSLCRKTEALLGMQEKTGIDCY